MNDLIICIAGKNNIAVNVSEYIRDYYPKVQLIACCNTNDDGKNGFQRSFRRYCTINRIPIYLLAELYDIPNLIFLSLEFDKIIKPELFVSNRLYNIHFSYLPEYKGMYTSALPILNSETYSGVTLHRIDSGIDTGEIITQTKFDLREDLTSEKLYGKYIEIGTKLIKENLNKILNNEIESVIQGNNKSSYFSKSTIDYNNVHIDLNKTAFQIKSQIHAYVFPAYQLPSVFNFSIYKAEIDSEKSSIKAGTLIFENDFYLVISSIDYNIKLFKDLREKLFAIATNGDIEKLKYFIENGYDIFQKSKEGWDIAIISAYNGKIDFLKYLLNELKWDINTKNNNGTTLVMYLMTYCSYNNNSSLLLDFLKLYRPIKRQIDYNNNDIAYYAEEYGNSKIIDIIKNSFDGKIS